MHLTAHTQCFFLQTRRLFHYASVLAVFLATSVIFMANSAHAATFVVSNTNDGGAGSFRQAIEDANDNLGSDLVTFDIPGAGIKTIFLQGGGPGSPSVIDIYDTVFIDGWTQGGSNYQGPPLIELRCQGNGYSCLEFRATGFFDDDTTASDSTLRGIIISESPSVGISIVGFGGLVDHVTIQGCYIGTNASGTGAGLVASSGISLNRSSHDVIGGAQASQRNVISANRGRGIDIAQFSEHNRVQGNYIGIDRTGTQVLPNLGTGVDIAGSSHNRVGGTAPGQGNVISGNAGAGVDMHSFGTYSSNNFVEGNYIGTLADGVSPAGNDAYGVSVVNVGSVIATGRNHIGGPTRSAGNVICDNGFGGILLLGSERNAIENNLIGVGADGRASLGNHGEGILIEDSSLNSIGGRATIGQFTLPAGNTIAFNSRTGVLITQLSGGPETGNLISRNSIWDNGGRTSGLGIDLAPGVLGITANDDCDLDTGPNRLQNFPVIDRVVSSPGVVTIEGVLLSSPAGIFSPGIPTRAGNGEYEIEFFANRSCSGSGNGQGEIFLGSTTVILKRGRCSARFQTTLNVRLGLGTVITATATDSRNNTSEFSECFPVVPGV
jgi:hypothetical protein